MAFTQYALSWDSYKSNICDGFAKLQQQQEFVDMTLVSEGHLVKVHKNLVALASPMIKHIIQTTPCEHPVIFLNSISHEVLQYILQYIYMGEVQVDINKMQAFMKAARELHLSGISGSGYMENESTVTVNPDPIDIEHIPVQTLNESTSIVNTVNNHEANNTRCDVNGSQYNLQKITTFNEDIQAPCSDWIENNEPTVINFNENDENNKIEFQINAEGLLPQQYTVSKRGSLQLILNRFMYSMHHHSLGGKKRRWRCINYRLLRCKAYVDTYDDRITARENTHSHTYHDDKILKKIKGNLIYGSVATAISMAKKHSDSNHDTVGEISD